MEQTWRWYGPEDSVTLAHVKQAGATGIVTALHDYYTGEVWPLDAIKQRNNEIKAAGLRWSVVESIPVHNSIKVQSAGFEDYIEKYKTNIRNVGPQFGVHTICYNFMPVVDWTRTDLNFDLPTSGQALRFDIVDFAAYDVFILARDKAGTDYSPEVVERARQRAKELTPEQVKQLETNIIAGLPGHESTYDRESLRARIAEYDEIDSTRFRHNLIHFLKEIIPVAEECGVHMCIHPDDPPFSLFGLPRVVSTAEDYDLLLSEVNSPANGVTFCIGSLGVRADNDLEAMVKQFGDRIYFTHLRNVVREGDGSFYEAEHLDGDNNIIDVVHALLSEEKRRKEEGRPDFEIPMRPDHGHAIMEDIGKDHNPGYSGIGRLKGLAELRGVIETIKKFDLV